jgi:hypothetical protein
MTRPGGIESTTSSTWLAKSSTGGGDPSAEVEPADEVEPAAGKEESGDGEEPADEEEPVS